MKKILSLRKKTVLRMMLIPVLILLIAGMIFGKDLAQAYRTLRYQQAPLVTESTELLAALDQQHAARATLLWLEDSGIYYGTDEQATYSYAVGALDDKYVIILETGDQDEMSLFSDTTTVLLGSLGTDSMHQEALRQIMSDYASYYQTDVSEIQNDFVPVVVRLETIRAVHLPGLWIFGILCVLSLGFMIWMTDRAIAQPGRKLSAEEMEQLDTEISEPLIETAHWLITQHYIIRKHAFKIEGQIIPQAQVAWLYKKIITRKIYGFIPAGKIYMLLLYVNGRKQPFSDTMKQTEADTLLTWAGDHLPQAVCGYQKNWEKLWKKHPERESFMAMIQEETTNDPYQDNRY